MNDNLYMIFSSIEKDLEYCILKVSDLCVNSKK